VNRSEQVNKISETIKSLQKQNEDWVDLASIGVPLSASGLNFKQLGYLKLRQYLETFSDILEFDEKNIDGKPPVYYTRLHSYSTPTQTEVSKAVVVSTSSVKNESTVNNGAVANDDSNDEYQKMRRRPLFEWAYFPESYSRLLDALKEKALKERWHFGNSEQEYPIILDRYLHYTFERLQFENKLKYNDDFAAFDTGLVNNQYNSIYLMFKKRPTLTKQQQWVFWDFAVAGEEWAGKEIVRQFNPLPQRAKYFDKISDCLYETKDLPQCDFTHILLERIDRLPFEFISDNCLDDSDLLRTDNMTLDEKKAYYNNLSKKIKDNPKILRNMAKRLKDSVELALKRVEWNYKTAIPMYYPKLKAMSLLLPIALVDDETVDVALVTEKTSSGAYLGHTILTLEMAYNNARLITRPDSDWLVTDSIKISASEIDDED
jgi:hypothetical protein